MVLLLALVSTASTFVVFASTTLVEEPATMTALVSVIALAIGLDLVWKWILGRRQARGGPASDQTDADAPGAPQLADAGSRA